MKSNLLRATARALMCTTLLLMAAVVKAVPLVEIDADVLTTDVQDAADISVGSQYAVDIVISGVDAPGINSYLFTMTYDPQVLAAVGADNGDFLLDPTLNLFTSLTPGAATLAVSSLVPVLGATGGGVLARLTFDVVGAGLSSLTLSSLFLSAPNGLPVLANSIQGAQASAASVALPSPATWLLAVPGLLMLGLRVSAREAGRSAR